MKGHETTYLSHSQVSDYQSCPKMYYLKRVAGVPETPSWWLPGGSAVHKVIEQYLKFICEGVSEGE